MEPSLFRSGTREDILILLFSNPEKRFYIREISRLIDQQPNAVRAELLNLEKMGILCSAKEGNLSFYFVNKTGSIFSELRSIIFKTFGLGSYLSKLFKKEEIKFAFIYGSTASGEDKKCSDIDLMIIGSPKMEELTPLISKAESKLRREINYSVFSESEFLSKKSSAFIKNVLNNKKLMLIGDTDELKSIGFQISRHKVSR